MDYFKIEEILAAANPAKEELKRKLYKILAAVELSFPQQICDNHQELA